MDSDVRGAERVMEAAANIPNVPAVNLHTERCASAQRGEGNELAPTTRD